MSKTKLTVLFVLLTLTLAPLAYARTKSFTQAMSIVKSFDKDTRGLVPDTLDKEEQKAFKDALKDNKKVTASQIKWLRRSEGPSPGRFSRLFKIIDRYTTNHIDEVDRLAAGLGDPDRGQLNDMSVELKRVREEALKTLNATSYSERKPDGRFKAEPVIDRSPYEERPGDRGGIYDR